MVLRKPLRWHLRLHRRSIHIWSSWHRGLERGACSRRLGRVWSVCHLSTSGLEGWRHSPALTGTVSKIRRGVAHVILVAVSLIMRIESAASAAALLEATSTRALALDARIAHVAVYGLR
jgi:hypothetical protein